MGLSGSVGKRSPLSGPQLSKLQRVSVAFVCALNRVRLPFHKNALFHLSELITYPSLLLFAQRGSGNRG